MLGLSDGGVDVTVEESNIKVTDDMLARLEELNALLNMDNKAPESVQEEKYKRKEELER